MCSLPDLLSSVRTRCFPKWQFPRGASDTGVNHHGHSGAGILRCPSPQGSRWKPERALRLAGLEQGGLSHLACLQGTQACRVHLTCVLHLEGLPPVCTPLRSWCHPVGGGALQRRAPGNPCTGRPSPMAGAVFAAGWGSRVL